MNCDIYIALGSNLGDRAASIRTGISYLVDRGVELVRLSRLYRSRPKYSPDQPWFANCVGCFRTRLKPRELLDVCTGAEKAAGRLRRERYGPRELDVDILLYGREVVSEKDLRIPHPAIPERLFVLVPLAEISGTLVVPGMGIVDEMLEKARMVLPGREEVAGIGTLTLGESGPADGEGNP